MRLAFATFPLLNLHLMKSIVLLLAMGLLAVAVPQAIAQHHHGASTASASPHPSMAMAAMPATSCTAPVIGYVPKEILQRPVPLRQKLGAVHDPVSTSSAEAQSFYNQGVAYLHGYVWIEAARSFHQALQHDPKLAMAYVGLSSSYLNFKDYAEARRMAEEAQRLAGPASEKEKLRINAQVARMAAVDSLHNEKLLKAYRTALDKALAADLDNAELWLLRGNAEEAMATGIGQQGNVTSIPYYEAAIARAPKHPAAYHYLVHSYENMGQFQKAEQNREIYAGLSSGIPHALHMYGHDLMKTGQIPAAIVYLGRADSLEQAYYQGEHISPALDWHHGHNLSLLGMSHRYLGQQKRSEHLFREIISLTPYFDEYAFMFKADLIGQLLSQGRAKDVLAIVNKKEGSNALEQAFDRINAGRAYLLLNKTAEAKAAREKAATEMPEVAKMLPEFPGFAAFYTQAYLDLLDGLLLFEAPVTCAEGAGKLRQHAQVIRNVFRGPDLWIAGLYELEDMARLARSKGDWQLATDMADQLYAHDPHYPGSLYAKALVMEHSGQKQESARLFANAAGLWVQADAANADAKTARKKGKTPR
jgi:tetratricopeptide (TPR) repeat protein